MYKDTESKFTGFGSGLLNKLPVKYHADAPLGSGDMAVYTHTSTLSHIVTEHTPVP